MYKKKKHNSFTVAYFISKGVSVFVLNKSQIQIRNVSRNESNFYRHYPNVEFDVVNRKCADIMS